MIENILAVVSTVAGLGITGSGTIAVKARKDTTKLHERVARLEEHRRNTNSALNRIEEKLDKLIAK